MKGRINSILWWAIGVNAFVLFLVFGLVYGAGARSSGLRLRDFTILPPVAGLELLFAAFLIVAVTIFLFIWLDSTVQKRVADLVDYAERLSAGDYEAHAPVTADDFGVLADSFNRASEKLARISQVEAERDAVEQEIGGIQRALEQIGRGELGVRLRNTVPTLAPLTDAFNLTAEGLSRRIERFRLTAGEIAAVANQAQAAATNCAAAIDQSRDELSASVAKVDQLAVTGRKISVDADGAADVARRALDYADQGNRAVHDAADGMQRLRSTIQATAAKIKLLGDRSLEIYEIINLIHETNLLALNAVLEASRGGQGDSLEVLASEMRKLGDHSRASTRDSVSLLKSIQAESNDSVVIMEQATRTAEHGARLTDQAGKAFAGIATLLRQTADLAQTASSASRQQAKNIDAAMTVSMSQAKMAERNTERASDALTQTEQVARLCEHLSQALAQFRHGPTVVKPEVKPETKPETSPEVRIATAGD